MKNHEVRFNGSMGRPPGGVRENGNVGRFSRISGKTTQFSGEHSRECRGVFPDFPRGFWLETYSDGNRSACSSFWGNTFKPIAPPTYFGSGVTLKDPQNFLARFLARQNKIAPAAPDS
jgi:hypothetical protein